jgi:hypothetical protein
VCNYNVYSPNIILNIDNNTINANVNRYPSFKDEIIMSTIVKNEDNIIKQWINYYKLFGVTRFIIYDNCKNNVPNTYVKGTNVSSDLDSVLKEYIDSGEVLLFNWDFGISFQQTQEVHSINAFKTAKYIGIFDVDEYINPQQSIIKSRECINLHTILDNHLKNKSLSRSSIGGIRILSRPFFNTENKSEANYDFLKIYNCENIYHHNYEKIFIIPENVNIMSVHEITNGSHEDNMNPEFMFINHYMFLNKERQHVSTQTNDSISYILHLLNIN